jgi:tRNA modification GTPase
LREGADEVERIGIERTWRALEREAGAALFIQDAQGVTAEDERLRSRLPAGLPHARVVNKIDLAGIPSGRSDRGADVELHISAKTGAGIEDLRLWLLDIAGWRPHGEGLFMARARHLVALEEAGAHLLAAARQLRSIELAAEELRLAQATLGRITGKVTADDLLGEIFGRFCIGK